MCRYRRDSLSPKKLTHPTQGCLGGYLFSVTLFVRSYFRSLTSLRSTIRAVSPPFGEEPWCSEWFKQLGSLQYARCRHRSVNCERSNNFLKKGSLFLYKERRQLWNITVNRYITRNNMQVQFIRFRQKIAFIQVMFYSMPYRSFTFCEATHSKQNASILIGRFEHNSLERFAAASGCMLVI